MNEQWENPNRTDNYLMQIAAEIRKGQVKNPQTVTIDSFKLKFKASGDKGPKMTREQATALSKSRWCGLMTMPITVINTKDGESKVIGKSKENKRGKRNGTRAPRGKTGGGRSGVRDQLE